MGQHGRDCRAAHAHIQHENEQWVEYNIGHRPQQYGQHPHAREPLAINIWVETQRCHHADCTQEINNHISRRIWISGIACAKQIQDRFVEDDSRRSQRCPGQQQHEISVRHDFLRARLIPLAARNCAQRCAAYPEEIGKRRDQCNYRKTKPQPSEGYRSLTRDFPDIDPIHDIVKQIEQLCNQHRRRNRQNTALDTARRKINLPYFHLSSLCTYAKPFPFCRKEASRFLKIF